MRIAFLGLGQMGAAIARHLVQTGYEITVWNRTASAAKPFVELGATAANSPAEAVAEAGLVFTMVHDDAALESVLFEQGAMDAIPAGALHVSLSTISIEFAQRLEREHAQRKQQYVGAPVFGRPDIAAAGKVWVVAAAPESVLTGALPVLQGFSRGVTVVGERPSMAHAVKLGGNFLITAMIASLSEAITFADSQGIDPDLFVETVNNALFQSPFYASYGKLMLHPPEHIASTVSLGIKDMRLFREAAEEMALPTPLADGFAELLAAAKQDGRGEDDWAAGYLTQVRSRMKAQEQA